MGWRPVSLLLIGLFIAGCAVSVVDLRNTLDLHRTSFHDKLAAKEELADAFAACTTRAYDEQAGLPAERSTPEADGRSDGPIRAIHTLVTRVTEGRPSEGESLQILEDTVADWSKTSYQRLDLRKLRKVVDVIRQWHGHFDFDEDALADSGSRFAQLLLAYNRAYFGDLRYTAGPTGTGVRGVAKVTSTGFVDRNGNVWRFPGLSVDVTKEPGQPLVIESSQVDSQRITSDLSRLFLEAFFDAAFRDPAVEHATALRVQWKSPGQTYPAFDADHPPIPLEAFARVTRDALRAEAAVTSEVGKAIRGGSLFSTQNETFAAGLETAAGVIAKKLVEHGGVCYFQTIVQSERRKEGTKG